MARSRSISQSACQTAHTPSRYMYQGCRQDSRKSTQFTTDTKTKRNPPQTIEIIEQDDDQREVTLAERLAGDGTEGYIDTIVNYDEDEGNLNIANVVKIGDKYITKEWQCGKDLKQKYAEGSMTKSINRGTFGGRQSFAIDDDEDELRVSRNLFESEIASDDSVELNPTFRGDSSTSRKQVKTRVDHQDCDLCHQDDEVFFDRSRTFSKRRNSLRKSERGSVHRKSSAIRSSDSRGSGQRNTKQRNNASRTTHRESKARNSHRRSITRNTWNRKSNRSSGRISRRSISKKNEFVDNYDLSFNEDANRRSTTSPLKVSNLKRRGSASPTSRKSVSFHRSTVNEFDPRESSYQNRRSGTSNSPDRLSASFARFDTPPPDEEDFEDFEQDFVDTIPGEGNKKDVRRSTFSASKNKTKSSTRKNSIHKRDGSATRSNGMKKTFAEQRNTQNRFSNSSVGKGYNMSEVWGDKRTSMKGLTKSSRTDKRNHNLKTLAIKIKRYGELEDQEAKIRNALCMQRNYNASFAFELLNPKNGAVNPSTLHDALRSRLKIDLVEKSVVKDIVERLAYVNEGEVLLTDMIFFEPYEDDESFNVYRRNFTTNQDETDTTWYSMYREMWKALINTVRCRRIIQKEMCEQFPEAVDYLFQSQGYNANGKFSIEEIENFINEQLNTEISQDLILAIMRTLDRDQDNLVSYQEFNDAFYGAE